MYAVSTVSKTGASTLLVADKEEAEAVFEAKAAAEDTIFCCYGLYRCETRALDNIFVSPASDFELVRG